MNIAFEVLQTGEFKDSAGTEHKFTEDNLQQIADSYNAAEHEAPLVIGHPTTEAPAYGWVEKLQKQGNKLIAYAKQVVPALQDWIKDGLYKKVSVALTKDNRLHHVGFLGAQAPAVEGLAPITFSETEIPYTAIETDTEISDTTSPLPDEKPEKTEPEAFNPNEELSALNDRVAELDKMLREKDETLTQKEREIDELKAAQKPLDNAALASEISAFSAFLSDSVSKGNLTPAQKDLFSKMIANLKPETLATFAEQPGNFFSVARQLVSTSSTGLLKPVNYGKPGTSGNAFDIAREAIAAKMR